MANFNTHIFGAAAVVSLGAVCATKLFDLSMPEGAALMIAGTVGGVLPDLDLRASEPSKALFSILGLFTGLIWLFANLQDLTGLELWLGTILVYLLVRFPLGFIFHKLTTHRGAMHSLIAAIMFSVVTCAIAWQHMQTSALQSWLLGASVLAGVLTHLTLDELYSVDFTGVRIRRSFGSALKPLDTQQLPASCLIIFITLVAWFWCAPFEDAFQQMNQRYLEWRTALIPTWL